MSSLLTGSPLEAAHEAARTVYPLPAAEGIRVGDVMERRVPFVEYGPQAIALAEAAAIAPYKTEIAMGIAAIEEMLALEAAVNE